MANQKSTELIKEMIELSVDVIRFCEDKKLPRSVVDQVTRSITSIGANFTEAQDASSKKDFVNKIYIAKKEAVESKYWLAIIYKLTNDENTKKLVERVHKFVTMLQKIINSSKEGNRK